MESLILEYASEETCIIIICKKEEGIEKIKEKVINK
jgi:hypothetical protein